MSIQRFTQEVKKRGLARTNRYEVFFNFPNTDSNGSQLSSIFCEATNLPGMSIATTPHRFFGEVREMPYERMFDPVTFSFYVDADMEVKAAFERWIHLIMNQKTRTMAYYNTYVKPVVINVYNVDNLASPDYSLTLHEAYPKSINSIQLSAESKEIMKVSVQMQYRYWTSSISETVVPKSVTAIPSLSAQDVQGIITSQAIPEVSANTWDPFNP